MSQDREIRPVTVIRPRLLPYLAACALLAVPVAAMLALRRDLTVEFGVVPWTVASAAAAAMLALVTFRLVHPRPLMRVTAGGIDLPRMIRDTLRWSDIKRIEATTRRGRTGDMHDRLLIHFKHPTVVNWRTAQLRRTLGDMPQAAVAVDIGFRWPYRADAVKRVIRDAARNFAAAPALYSDAAQPGGRRVLIGAVLALFAAAMPPALHIADIGLPRLLSEGMALYRAGETAKALPILERDARAGDTEAAFVLGTLYLNGDGVDRNPSMAAAWFKRAAARGHADAETRLGDAYRLGLGTPQDTETAIRWYRRASDNGSAEAAYVLSRLYRLGDGVRRDYEKAIHWLETAAGRGFAPAEHDLGQLYHEGVAVPRDVNEAIRRYTRAAQLGHVPSRYDLARLLLDGKKDGHTLGMAYLRSAAEAGYAPAQRRLAKAYMGGQEIRRDPVEAYKWISLAERAWPSATRADLVREKARIAAGLDPEQLSDGKERVRAWRPMREQEL